MISYIAQFTAQHRIIQVQQNTIFIWKQERGDVDVDFLAPKIIRESSIHFFRLVVGQNYEVIPEDITVTVLKIEPFNG